MAVVTRAEGPPRPQRRVRLSHPQNQVLAARGSVIADIAGQGGGKTKMIGFISGWMITKFPEAKGFIAANTIQQLAQSTLTRVFSEWSDVYGLSEYNKQSNPLGHYVVGKMPPRHWKASKFKFPSYHGIISFWNGAVVLTGSLENYEAHDGKEFAWAHLDETKDTKKEAITDVILGRLRQMGLWVTKSGKVIWAEFVNHEVAARTGLTAWNPLYIHTSPAEGTVDWLIDLLGIAPYHKEIKETITKRRDYWYRELIKTDDGVETKTSVVIYSAYWNEDNLPPNYIPGKKSRMGKSEQLKFIYGYPFGRNGGEYFPAFDRFKHMMPLEYQKGKSIHTAWDFNASPYVTCLISQVEYVMRWYDPVQKVKYNEYREGTAQMQVLQIRFLRELCMEAPMNTTEQTATAFADDYASHNADVFIYGDASGLSRIEGLGAMTQYKIIAKYWADRIYQFEGQMRVKKTNLQVSKRRDLLNMIFSGRLPEVEVLIDDQNCPNLIKDCEYLLQGKDGGKYKEEEKDKNGIKVQKLGHCADAMEYEVCVLCEDFLKEL